MRILLCNHALDLRSGSELYIRDVALALLARGHEPIAYSRWVGEVAEELRRATVPVLDDLEELKRPPDVLHVQHHLEAMTSITRFPRVPAVYVCHGWLPDEEAPPRHPRIRRYVAVDELVRQRLLDECGIPAARVTTLLNFVDLNRFLPRPPLPRRPARALVFSNQAREDSYLPAVREACGRVGLAVDVVGRGVERPCPCPEEILGRYDVVFAKGRSALEAAAVGAAVVLCDGAGLGPMVTSSELLRLRAYNFGVRLLRRPVTIEALVQELERYDPSDAAEVTRRLRQEVSLEDTTDRLIELYEEVLSEYDPATVSEDEEAKAVARYLRRGPLAGGSFFQSEKDRWAAEAARAVGAAGELRAHLARALEHGQSVEKQLEAAAGEQRRLASALEEARREAEEARRGVEEARRGAEEARREAESRQRQLEQVMQENRNQQGELRWIRSSMTWRWREWLVSQRWLVALYRAIFSKGPRPD